MIWHYDGGVKVVAFVVVVQAVLEYGVPGFGSEWGPIAFAEGYEYCSSWFLVVREVAAVFVFSFQGVIGHGGVLTGSKFKSKNKIKTRSKAKARARSKAKSKASDRSVRPTFAYLTLAHPTRAT
jgi:hypothetical protein